MDSFTNTRAKHIACGNNHTAVIDENGKVSLIGGKGFDKCNQDLLKHSTCTQVECGLFHTVALLNSGQVTILGKNLKDKDHGQCDSV